jgi:excisionase family DNA binding protein
MESSETLISAREAAKRLGISRASLSRLVRARRIGVYRVGGRTMFDESVIDAFKRSIYIGPMMERI